jgi:hypothetical protein
MEAAVTKYAPLCEFLKKQNRHLIQLTFSEIEKLIGAPLPPSARKHRPWWSNNPKNSVITDAWLAAGYRSEQVDMETGKLVFRRADAASEPRASFEEPRSAPSPAVRHPLFGALKGLIRIPPGVDLTEPADPDWGKDN